MLNACTTCCSDFGSNALWPFLKRRISVHLCYSLFLLTLHCVLECPCIYYPKWRNHWFHILDKCIHEWESKLCSWHWCPYLCFSSILLVPKWTGRTGAGGNYVAKVRFDIPLPSVLKTTYVLKMFRHKNRPSMNLRSEVSIISRIK